MVGKDEHEHVLDDVATWRQRLTQAHAMLQRFAWATPHEGRWQHAWLALQVRLREALTVLDATPASGRG